MKRRVVGTWKGQRVTVEWDPSGEVVSTSTGLADVIDEKFSEGVFWAPIDIEHPRRTDEYESAAVILSSFDEFDWWTFDWEHSPDVVSPGSGRRAALVRSLRERKGR